MELADRLEVERRLASRLAILSAAQRRTILSAIGSPPDVERLTDEFWAGLEAAYQEELAAQALIVYLLMLRQQWDDWQPMAGELLPTISPRGIAWAESWASDAAARWTATTRDRLRTRPLAGMGEERLRAELVDIIGPNRIASLAVTGTTDAASAGSLGARDELARKLGIHLTAIWRTERDARVCPICSPLEGTIEPSWRESFPTGPSAHPLCRCHLDYFLYKPIAAKPQLTPWYNFPQ